MVRFTNHLPSYFICGFLIVSSQVHWLIGCILTLHTEVDARGWDSSLVGGDAAVPARIICCYVLDLQRQVGGESRTRSQSDVRTATLPGQVKAHGAGHHAGQECSRTRWRCHIVRHGDVRWRLYSQTNTKKNISAFSTFLTFLRNIRNYRNWLED